MDIATIIGLIAGVLLLLIPILTGPATKVFFSAPSAIMVVGGTIAATLINYPLSEVLGVFATFKNALLHKEQSPAAVIDKIVHYATVARREGILALESQVSDAGDEFLEKSVQLAIDGTAPELIKDILTTELAFMEDRHAMGQSILIAMGTYAPAFGMIGTLVGLVTMLVALDDPSSIGVGMALALLTTLYGAVMANLVFLPAAGKLKVRTSGELLTKEVIIEGILSIQSGDNPRIVEQKLKAFVAPDLRETIGAGR